VDCMGDVKSTCIVLVVNLKGGAHLGDLCVDWRIILKCILSNSSDSLDWIDLAQDTVQ
jgi:hypothetical protein